MKKNTRIYPESCLSMYCGETVCPDNCQFLPALKDFKQWVKDNNAKCSHPDSLIYYAKPNQSLQFMGEGRGYEVIKP